MTMHFVGVVAEAIIAIMWVPLIDAVVFGLWPQLKDWL